jgi:hypothetical protein
MPYGGENIIGSSFSFGDTNVLGVVFSVRRGLFLIFRIHMGSMIGVKGIVDLFIFSYKTFILQFAPKKLPRPKNYLRPFKETHALSRCHCKEIHHKKFFVIEHVERC